MNRKQRYAFILEHFRQYMPEVGTELHFNSPFQLLVATILSAQCTDKRVNEVTPALFQRFPDAAAMAAAEENEIHDYVRSVSYPNAKSKHLSAMAKMLVEEFNGVVPSTPDQLTRLPGVGRKTANVVQAVAFGKATMAVDTHVFRVSRRMGLVGKNDNTPFKVEQQLMKNIPETDIPNAHHWLLLHGRYVCTSRKPKCDKCPFDEICPKNIENDK
ncbi:MAG: endonuclease III [Prevotella sp.]|nr:endonuclease III [Prevotella sp.]